MSGFEDAMRRSDKEMARLQQEYYNSGGLDWESYHAGYLRGLTDSRDSYLVAAAPDLLEACRIAEEYLKYMAADSIAEIGAEHSAVAHDHQILVKAIAKATGGAPANS